MNIQDFLISNFSHENLLDIYIESICPNLLYQDPDTIRAVSEKLKNSIKKYAESNCKVYKEAKIYTRKELFDKDSWVSKEICVDRIVNQHTSGSTTGDPFNYFNDKKYYDYVQRNSEFDVILKEYNLYQKKLKILNLFKHPYNPSPKDFYLEKENRPIDYAFHSYLAKESNAFFVNWDGYMESPDHWHQKLLELLESQIFDIVLASGPVINILVRYIKKYNFKHLFAKLLSHTTEFPRHEDFQFLKNNGNVECYCDHMRCWDGGASFFTCKYNTYHLLDNLTWVYQGESNEMISTDYFNMASPFINYWNGDLCEIKDEYKLCQCGRHYRPFKMLQNRPFALKGPVKLTEIKKNISELSFKEKINQVQFENLSVNIYSYSELKQNEKNTLDVLFKDYKTNYFFETLTPTIEEFYKTNIIDENFDEALYEEQYPETKDFYQPYCEQNNISNKQRLYFHYYFHCPREIFLKVNNGLANRLRTLNSFWSFAKQNNIRKLKVCWTSGPGWSDELFFDLFEPFSDDCIEFVSLDEYEQKRLSGDYLILDKLVVKSDFNMLKYIYIEPKKYIFNQLKKCSFCYDGDSCLEYMFEDIENKINIYDKLLPKQSIQNLIDKILQNSNFKDFIGMHVRRGDVSSHPHASLYEISDNESFEKIIDEYLKTNPETKFFLSTDCSKTQKHFISKYKNILYNDHKKFVDSINYLFPKENQKDALIDLILLSKTNQIVGSNYSSFSKLAAEIGRINIIIAKNENKIKKTNKLNGSTVKIDYLKDWQFPAYTEKQAWINHSNKNFIILNDMYVAFPWASLIDDLIKKYGSECNNWIFDDIINYFEALDLSKNSHTVCQHIFWKGLIPLWRKIGIKNIHISHLTNKDKNEYSDINLLSWHLIAPNSENNWLNKDLIIKSQNNKKYLFSFIGAYNKYYPSDIRKNLFDIYGSCENDNIFFKLNIKWFFNEIVYDYQLNNKAFNAKELEIKAQQYNQTLSESVFSLCPEGTGPNTLRLWESMSVGSVPVLFENDWMKPEIAGFNWSDLAIFIKNNELEHTADILQQIDKNKLEEMSFNCISAYNKVRLKTCF